LAGTTLLAYALKRKGAVGMIAAAAGAGLLYRASKPKRLSRQRGESLPYGEGVMVKESLVVEKPASELYALWRDLENLPAFMRHVESVRSTDPKRSHWKIRGPTRASLEWDAEVIADREDELIGWRTLQGERVAHAGSVRFVRMDDDPNRTKVAVALQFNPPARETGAAVARLLGGDPQSQIREDLQRFKTFAESMDLHVLERLAEQRAWAHTKEED